MVVVYEISDARIRLFWTYHASVLSWQAVYRSYVDNTVLSWFFNKILNSETPSYGDKNKTTKSILRENAVTTLSRLTDWIVSTEALKVYKATQQRRHWSYAYFFFIFGRHVFKRGKSCYRNFRSHANWSDEKTGKNVFCRQKIKRFLPGL